MSKSCCCIASVLIIIAVALIISAKGRRKGSQATGLEKEKTSPTPLEKIAQSSPVSQSAPPPTTPEVTCEIVFEQFWYIQESGTTIEEREDAYHFLEKVGGKTTPSICGLEVNSKTTYRLIENGSNPCWSPRGRYIAFTCNPLRSEEKDLLDPSQNWSKYDQIYVASPDGRRTRRVTQIGKDIGDARDPVWTKDEKTIIFSASGKLYEADFQDGEVVPLNIDGIMPAVSPDGKQIAVIRDRPSSSAIEVYTLDRKRFVSRIEPPPKTKERYMGIVWSKRGGLLFYTSKIEREEGYFKVLLGSIELLSERVEVIHLSENKQIGKPTLSPREKEIVFSCSAVLYKIGTDGSGLLPLTLFHTKHPLVKVISQQPSWRPAVNT